METELTDLERRFCAFPLFCESGHNFEEHVGFGDLPEDAREIPVVNSSISYAQIRSFGFTNNGIDTDRKAYTF